MRFRYHVSHETPRHRPGAGTAASAGRPALKNWQEALCRGERVKRFGKLRVSMVASLPEKRDVQPEAASRFGAAPQTLPGSTRKTPGDVGEWPLGRRLRHRSVDPGTHWSDNPPAFRRDVSSLPCVETPDQPGFDLSETRATGFAAQRGSDLPLETPEIASDKKKPKSWEPTSSSSTKVGSRLSLTSSGLGRSGGRRLFCATSMSKTRFRPSTRSRCLPAEGAWASTSISGRTTSPGSMSSPSFNIFSNTSKAPSSSFGTGGPSTGARRSRFISPAAHVSLSNGSRLTLPNSTRRSTSGIKTIRPWPTGLPQPSINCGPASTTPRGASARAKICFGPAFTPLTCLGGGRNSFHYLCNTQ